MKKTHINKLFLVIPFLFLSILSEVHYSAAQGKVLQSELSAHSPIPDQRPVGLESGTWSDNVQANYSEIKKLDAEDAQSTDYFGWAVAVSGNTAVVGAFEEDGGAGDPLPNFGGAYVFERNQGGGDNWGQTTKLFPQDPQAGDVFGYSVAISGDTIVVGSFSEDGGPGDPSPVAGAVYVFERNLGGPDNWGQSAKLMASDAEDFDFFGVSVAISGDTIVVSAPTEDGGAGSPLNNAGAAYVFERNLGGVDNWGEAAKLTASDASANDEFGTLVAISGDTIVSGAIFEGVASGAAYVYERNFGGPDNWGESAKLTASDAQNWDLFGSSSAIDGDTIAVGARMEDGGQGDPILDSGAVYIYERDLGGAGNWGEAAKITAGDAQANDEFGYSVGIYENTLVVGAIKEDGGPGDPSPNAGSAYVFERDLGGAGNWGQAAQLSASDAQAGDLFGISVAMSGTTLIVGAYEEDGGAGDPLPDSGAAYIYYVQIPFTETIYLPVVIRQES